MKNNDININISPKEDKKELVYTQVGKWFTSTIANAKWTKIIKVYFVTFFFLATALTVFYAYNIVKNEEFIKETSHKIVENTKEEELRDFVVTPKVQHDIEVLLYTLGADRVFIFELHNGKKNMSGLPFRYADMSYEITNREKGVVRCYKKFQDVPLNMYTFPNYLYKNKQFVGTIDEIEKIDYEFAKSIKEEGGKYASMVYLNGSEGPIGFLGVTFHDAKNLPDNELITSKLESYGNTISELLDLQIQLSKRKNISNSNE